MSTQDSNKRIVKNTLLLYFRMLFMMAVTLYTSRVILNALGVEDFGIYNVVGGVVAMFYVLSNSLSASISRFITYELGKGNKERLNRIFSASVTIQSLLSFIIVVLIELLGVWFLNNKMDIPANRVLAANWVLQFSVVTFVVDLISVPYNAVIVAHEKMSAFAYISILDAVGKLLISCLIYVSPMDKLVFYAILMCLMAVVVRMAYGIYCKKHFEECKFHFYCDTEILKNMFGFAGWNFIGAASGVLRDQGVNVVINLFCGPTVNAARGIAMQVSSAVTSFASNFMTAVNPQITKSYANGNKEYMMTLMFQGGRLSFYMILMLALPVLVNAHYILALWLKIVPEHTVLFVQWIIFLVLSESLSYPLITAMLATGKIRNYQIVVGGLQMLNLPFSYILLRFGCIPESVLIIAFCLSQCCLIARLLFLRNMIGLSIVRYIRNVYINVILVTVLSACIPIAVAILLPKTFVTFVFITLISIVCTFLVIYYIGCNKVEREFVIIKIKNFKNKIYK